MLGNIEKLLFGALVCVHLLPIWGFQYFPTQDGPAHLYNATILRDYFDPEQNRFWEYYAVNASLFPNWLTSLLLIGLLQGFPLLAAEKILISIYIVGLPVAVRYSLTAVAQQAGWISVLVFPILYNDLFYRGFYNFIISVSIFFLIVGYWLRHRCTLQAQQLALMTGMILVLYFSHIVALVALFVTLVLLEFALASSESRSGHDSAAGRAHKRVWQLLTRIRWLFLLGLTPALVLAMKFVLERESTISYSSYSWKTFFWWAYGTVSVANSPIHLLSALSIALLWLVLIGYSVACRNIQPSGCYFNGVFFSGITLFALHLLAPESLSGGSFLNQRLLLFALLLMIVWFGSLRFSSRARVSIIMSAVAIALMNVVLNLHVYASINRDANQYISAVDSIEPNHTILALCFATEGCGASGKPGYLRISPLSHFSSYLAAQRRLVTLSNDHAHMDYFPIRYRQQRDPSPYTAFVEVDGRREWGRNLGYYGERTGGSIDYVLLWHIADAWHRGEDTTPLMDWLSEGYVLILTSATGKMQLYRKVSKSSDWVSSLKTGL